jgi:tripartite-type tricarboxylate transporter receptor subunit TctC
MLDEAYGFAASVVRCRPEMQAECAEVLRFLRWRWHFRQSSTLMSTDIYSVGIVDVRSERGDMKLLRRRFLHLAAGVIALPAISRIARAQPYPARAITIIVPFPAGGSTDTLARIIAEQLRDSFRQPVIVENVAGAGGTIGVGRASRATGDGYTLSIGTVSTHILTGALYTLPYDLLKDFEPISLLAVEPLVIVAKKSMPAKNLSELIAWLKANPDKASAGIAGVGTAGHVTGVLFQKETRTRFQFVPYRGVVPAMQDLVAGQIDLEIDASSNFLPQVRTGSIKAYAVTAKTRLAAAGDIPTVDEAGLPGVYASLWYGLWAPKPTPKDVIAKLNTAVVNALASAPVRQRLAELGSEIPPRDQQTPEALAVFQKAEIEKWWPIIRAANIKGE